MKYLKKFESNSDGNINDVVDILLDFFDEYDIKQTPSDLILDSKEFWEYVGKDKYYTIDNRNNIFITNLSNHLENTLIFLIRDENDRINSITGLWARVGLTSRFSIISLTSINPKSNKLHNKLNILGREDNIKKVKYLNDDNLNKLESLIKEIENLLRIESD